MRGARALCPGIAASLLALGLTVARTGEPQGKPDPLAAEIARWSAYLRDNTSKDDTWTQTKEVSEPVLRRAEEALRDGRRLLALSRLAAVRVNLAAYEFLSGRPSEQRSDPAAFEAEWTRLGKVLREDLEPPSAAAFEGVHPAALRGIAEATLPQVRIYYDASLEYGRNTMPDSGLFYLDAARAQREFAAFCRSLSQPSSRRPPRLRGMRAEIDALEHDLLVAYRPPASIDRHGEFILASSILKEARELDGMGLRYGALLRYLQAALRTAPLRAAPPASLEADRLATRLRDLDARLSAGNTDHSIGRLLLETAQADAAHPAPGATPAVAPAIVSDVLPRYFAALEPARREAPRPAPKVTVTLVRWPYT
jgi:hypothetical protein